MLLRSQRETYSKSRKRFSGLSLWCACVALAVDLGDAHTGGAGCSAEVQSKLLGAELVSCL